MSDYPTTNFNFPGYSLADLAEHVHKPVLAGPGAGVVEQDASVFEQVAEGLEKASGDLGAALNSVREGHEGQAALASQLHMMRIVSGGEAGAAQARLAVQALNEQASYFYRVRADMAALNPVVPLIMTPDAVETKNLAADAAARYEANSNFNMTSLFTPFVPPPETGLDVSAAPSPRTVDWGGSASAAVAAAGSGGGAGGGAPIPAGGGLGPGAGGGAGGGMTPAVNPPGSVGGAVPGGGGFPASPVPGEAVPGVAGPPLAGPGGAGPGGAGPGGTGPGGAGPGGRGQVGTPGAGDGAAPRMPRTPGGSVTPIAPADGRPGGLDPLPGAGQRAGAVPGGTPIPGNPTMPGGGWTPGQPWTASPGGASGRWPGSAGPGGSGATGGWPGSVPRGGSGAGGTTWGGGTGSGGSGPDARQGWRGGEPAASSTSRPATATGNGGAPMMGGMGGGGAGQGGSHRRPPWLVEDDPESIWLSDLPPHGPAVIGE